MSLEPRGATSPPLRGIAIALIVTASLSSLVACESRDGRGTGRRAQLMESEVVRRLVGTWDVSFTADRRASISLASSSDSVTGTLAFTADHHGPTSMADLHDITHEGSYDLDFQPFGWTTRSGEAPAVAIARVVAAPAAHAGDAAPDSLFVVLSPGTKRFAVRMAGAFAGDSAWGLWSARAYSAGGGVGRFVMRRRTN